MTLLGRAQKKLADLVSRRPHSKKELAEKLSRTFDKAVVQETLQWAEDCDLLDSEENLSQRVTEELQRKGKGTFYIQNYLKKKGLPSTIIDAQSELEIARQLIDKEMKGRERVLTYPEKVRLSRFLTNRGFQSDIIREIIFNRHRNS